MNLSAIVQKWAKILRLSDWDITISADPDLAPPNAGYCDAMCDYKSARICVATWPDEKTTEDTIVHELLHLHLSPFQTESGSAARTWEEQAVESITRGFMDIARNGAPIATVQRRARLIVASEKRRLARRHRMDPKRYGEIMMELGSMELDAKAKALVAELASMTVGGDGPTSEPEPPMLEELKPSDAPMAGGMPGEKPDPMARASRLIKATEDLAARQYRRALVTEARSQLGTDCTPDFERKLLAATPEVAEAMLEGAMARGPARQTTPAREGQATSGGNVVPLRRGEDETKLSPLQKQTRQRLADQLGTDGASAALQASNNRPTRTVGRKRGG